MCVNKNSLKKKAQNKNKPSNRSTALFSSLETFGWQSIKDFKDDSKKFKRQHFQHHRFVFFKEYIVKNAWQMKSPLHLTPSRECMCVLTQISWWVISLEVTQVLERSNSLEKKKKIKLPTSCFKWNNNPELREQLPSLQMANYLSADTEQCTLCSWCMRFPVCAALERKGVWSYTIILFY